MNKLKICYFFAHSLETLEQEYLNNNLAFKISIVAENRDTLEKAVWAKMELSFKDLIIPINRKKDFYKFFTLENCAYGWGLEGSLGVIPSDG